MEKNEAIKILKRGHPDETIYAVSEYEDYQDCVALYDEAIEVAIKALEDLSHIIEALEELKDDTLDELVSFGVEKSIDCIKNMRRKDT